MVVWGTCTSRRELLRVNDLADVRLLMRHFDDALHINIGTDIDQSLGELARVIGEAIHPEGYLRQSKARRKAA